MILPRALDTTSMPIWMENKDHILQMEHAGLEEFKDTFDGCD
jgi:hypothetical protein